MCTRAKHNKKLCTSGTKTSFITLEDHLVCQVRRRKHKSEEKAPRVKKGRKNSERRVKYSEEGK